MWDKIKKLHDNFSNRSIADLFIDTGRAQNFSIAADGLLFDYSKTNLDVQQRAALLDLAKNTGVGARRDAMLRGDKINVTEDRAVLHTVLRRLEDTGLSGQIIVDGVDAFAASRDVYERLKTFATNLRSGDWQGAGGKITDVVNIGIGGSDLGPAMAYLALRAYADGPRCHFVSNVDAADLNDVLQGLNPKTTLVIVASKSFTTQETIMNARAALCWMQKDCPNPLRQFVAISTELDQTEAFGIPEENVFGFGEWIGGRYSIWGPIGLSLMLSVGVDDFAAFLQGGRAMDLHFETAPFAKNMPVLLALVGLWHQKFCDYPARAVIPYEQRLRRLPAYLQQLEMESNGKNVGIDGQKLPHGGGPVVWGEPGTNGQHAFFQLLHQSSDVVPIEFLVGAEGHEQGWTGHHEALVANCFAQSESLLRGRTLAESRKVMKENGLSDFEIDNLAPHKQFSGNRPSTTLAYPKLTPFVFGQILALYEHRVFVEGVILGLNSFDQWGVELGKEMASDMIPAVSGTENPKRSTGSTVQLLNYVRRIRQDS